MLRYIIGVTGASGVKLSVRLIEELHKFSEVYTIVSNSAKKVIEYEGGSEVLKKIKRYSKNVFNADELDAPISSMSFPVNGMIIIPCSMNTIAKLANGIICNLISRVADNQIRMRNKLVLVPREAPLNQIHLRNMLKLSKIDSVYILFPVLTYYHDPKTIEDMENFVTGKILDILGIAHNLYRRWNTLKKLDSVCLSTSLL
jgi:4-hydroxy-3-polyprenylbenzoate decarboxylase